MRSGRGRLARGCKYTAIMVLIFCIVNFYILLILMAKDSRSHERKRKSEPLEQTLERSGWCETVYNRYDNSTRFQNTNESVRTACDHIIATKKSFYRIPSGKANPYRHKFIIPGSEICDEDTEVVILIHSLHSYVPKRHAIRKTWGGATVTNMWPTMRLPRKVKLAFVLGVHPNETMNKELLQENDVYQDIVQGDFGESYKNMTLKSLLDFKWVLDFCPQIRYLIKSDDDMIINVPALMTVIERSNLTRAIMGPLNRGSRAMRAGKWALSKSSYPFYYFPPYESGSAYVVSGDLIKAFYDIAEFVPHIFIDDVYITGILGQILNVRHIEQPGFAYWTNKKPTVCDIKENYILTGHKMKPDYMHTLWKDLIETPTCNKSVNSIRLA